MTRIRLNGEPADLPDGHTLADLVPAGEGHAVAVNGVVVPRSRHREVAPADGDVVDVVVAVAGG